MRSFALLLGSALAPLLLATDSARAQAAPRAEFVGASESAPLSRFVRVGETIYLSGALGTTPEGTLAPGGIAAETRQTLLNIQATLQQAGATLDDVVKCTVFLADMQEWGAMNEVYRTGFARNKPARTAVGVTGLARNARVEIECVAVRGAGRP